MLPYLSEKERQAAFKSLYPYLPMPNVIDSELLSILQAMILR